MRDGYRSVWLGNVGREMKVLANMSVKVGVGGRKLRLFVSHL